MQRVLLIIGGGIAAYKAPELVRRLRDHGLGVRCLLTSAAAQFVAPLSLASVSGDRVYENLFDLTDEAEMGHIQLSRDADLFSWHRQPPISWRAWRTALPMIWQARPCWQPTSRL